MSTYNITVKKTSIDHKDRVYDFYAHIIITDDKNRMAEFILHGEPEINKYKFSNGKTSNGVKLWTKHDRNTDKGGFESDLNFIKIGRWGKKQDRATEFADMLNFMNECHGLKVLYTDKPGTITYKIIDGKICNIYTDEIRDLYELTYESMCNYDFARFNGFPVFYVEKMKKKAEENYKQIERSNREADFYNYVKLQRGA